MGGNDGEQLSLPLQAGIPAPARPASIQPKVDVEAKPAVGAEAKPAVGGEAKPAVGGEAKPAVGGEAKPAVGGEAKPAVERFIESLEVGDRSIFSGVPQVLSYETLSANFDKIVKRISDAN